MLRRRRRNPQTILTRVERLTYNVCSALVGYITSLPEQSTEWVGETQRDLENMAYHLNMVEFYARRVLRNKRTK